jgi:signal transduction histidine kinase
MQRTRAGNDVERDSEMLLQQAESALQSAQGEIAALELRRIGQDLHDSVGQELIGIGLTARTLLDALIEQESPEVALAAKLVEGIRRALGEVRMLSRGLIPVEVDALGLMSALTDLAARLSDLYGINCRFEYTLPVLIEDNVVATHLYRIAQEAATNAIKHAQASQITLSLKHERGSLKHERGRIALRIRDDGIGIQNQQDAGSGLGLSIMRHRAGLIHATLCIDPVEAGGTLVTCTINDHEGSS